MWVYQTPTRLQWVPRQKHKCGPFEPSIVPVVCARSKERGHAAYRTFGHILSQQPRAIRVAGTVFVTSVQPFPRSGDILSDISRHVSHFSYFAIFRRVTRWLEDHFPIPRDTFPIYRQAFCEISTRNFRYSTTKQNRVVTSSEFSLRRTSRCIAYTTMQAMPRSRFCGENGYVS